MNELTYLTLSDLSPEQLVTYRQAVIDAFPAIINESEIIQTYWDRIESYFPDHQLFAIDKNGSLIGFANAIPCHWDQPIKNLPQEGWDWLVKKGITDHEQGIAANLVGGLQIIITKHNLGKGYSKLMIAKLKELKNKYKYDHLAIPIRPTFKHKHPEMKMSEYLKLQKDGQVYDPWIRTHLKCGAAIIKVCENSMNFKGDIAFWESLMNQKIKSSGTYTLEGALNQIIINLEENTGEYREENIWVYYG